MKTVILEFLTQLGQNNTREWFQANKSRYEEAKREVESFVNSVIPAIAKFDETIRYVEAKDCMFRIFRDVRFGGDKSPYKTNFGAFVARGGRKSSFPGYYFHFEPGESMLAGGVYMPPPDVLKLLRNEVYYHSDEFKGILSDPSFHKHFDQLGDFDKLKKPPKDFPVDFPDVDLLKYRSYIVSRVFQDTAVTSGDYRKQLIEMVKELQPFMAFLNRAISNAQLLPDNENKKRQV